MESLEQSATFDTIYSFYIPPILKSFLSPDDLRLFMDRRLGFFREFSGNVKIRVYNPGEEFHWLVNSSVIEILMPDSPFIVDTVLDYCNFHDSHINLIIHPVLQTRRDNGGLLQESGFADFAEPAANLESYLYMEIGRLDEGSLEKTALELTKIMEQLRIIVSDFPAMLEALRSLQYRNPENAADARWLLSNFVFLGASFLSGDTLSEARYGILRTEEFASDASLEYKQWFPSVSMTHDESLVFIETALRTHTSNRRYVLFVRATDGERSLLLTGYFVKKVDMTHRDEIPPVRRRIETIARSIKAPPTSHLRKEMSNLCIMFPASILFTREENLLFAWLQQATASLYTEESEVVYHIDDPYGLLWVQSIIPSRDTSRIPGRRFEEFKRRFSLRLRHEIRYSRNDRDFILLGIVSETMDPEQIREALLPFTAELFSSWRYRFRQAVENHFVGEEQIRPRLLRYREGLSPDYEIHQEPEEAIHDLEILDTMAEGSPFLARYYARTQSEDCIKIHMGRPVQLSELVPVIIHFGFTVLAEYTFPYSVENLVRYTYAFTVPVTPGLRREDRERIASVLSAALNGKTTAEPINALAVSAGLDRDEINLVKSLASYIFQIDRSYSRQSLQSILLKYPIFTSRLVALFHSRFGPDSSPSREDASCRSLEEIYQTLESSLDEQLCRGFQSLVQSIVRTNYYLRKGEIAFKVHCPLILNMPRPVPLYEIFVYGTDMEGTHLRGGYVARGGIRWSDRADDFRTEILGLMKAQMVKNTIIVPVGSKGGFVIKNRTFADRAALLEAGRDVYRRFIASLLDLTDNLSPSGEVVPAPGIHRVDGDDTYLVVAADKGTASFSDIANEVSRSKSFWLSDAFASGGHNGYDHKEQGITAKGAWESIRRHFLELGLHPDHSPLTIVGIGDMSGDVFGNGLLLSRSVRLLGAFNHLYIFLDPNPDPEKSYEERLRLFREGGNWDRYQKELISRGGGVYRRSERRIELSPEVKEALSIRSASLSGEELIRAILCAPVDLLWNGGIGTYIKASSESHYDAGDPANDRVRVDAADLRVRVVGEGGNLGFTQEGRIEAATKGIRINTDAIDNSGGVDMSDHEVNLKILLDTMVRRGVLRNEEERNQIVRKYEGEMIRRVLRHNYENNLALSLDERRIPQDFAYVRIIIRFLIREGILNREQDRIPFEGDLDSIEETHRTLPRPVLCSLMGFGKLYLEQQLIKGDGFGDPVFDAILLRYFPDEIAKQYTDDIRRHPLRREIVITEVVNEIMNYAGFAFFQRMLMLTGAGLAQIATVYMKAADFLRIRDLREELVSEETGPAQELHYRHLILLEQKVFRIVQWILEEPSLEPLLQSPGTDAFLKILDEAVLHNRYRFSGELRSLRRNISIEFQKRTQASFSRVDAMEDSFHLFVSQKRDGISTDVKRYFHMLEKYRIRELRSILTEMKPHTGWEAPFLSRIDRSLAALGEKIMQPQNNGKELEERSRHVIEEILTHWQNRTLTLPAFFEMLEHINRWEG